MDPAPPLVPWLSRSAAVLTGLMTAGCALALWVALVWTPDPLHKYASQANQVSQFAGVGFALLLGAYAGAAGPWLLAKRGTVLAPSTATRVAGFAFLLCFIATAVTIPHVVTRVNMFAAYLTAAAVALATLCAIAWALTRSERLAVEPPSFARRLAMSLAVVVVLGGLTGRCFFVPPYPGDGAPAATRRAWAEATFGASWRTTCRFLQASPEVARHLGGPLAIAPGPGPNRGTESDLDRDLTFTLEVVGPKGQGTARLRYRDGDLRGTLELPGGQSVALVRGTRI